MSQPSTLTLHTSRMVIVLILVATGLPADLGPPRIQLWRWDLIDVFANILLYLPLGLTLAERMPAVRVVQIAGCLSTTIELAQLFYVNRIAHPLDVVCNILGALLGHAVARGVRVPRAIRVSRVFGATLLITSAVWILSSRTFRMYVGGFGWFASERAHPQFWSMLPAEVLHAGVQVHMLGVLVHTGIAAILVALGINGLIQSRHQGLRIVLGGAAGFCVGNMMTPHLNVFPLGPALVGTGAGLALATCFQGQDTPKTNPLA